MASPFPSTSDQTHTRHSGMLPHCRRFFARDSVCCISAHMPSQFRPSVCLSVCLSNTRVDQSKTVEVRIMQFSQYSSPIPLVYAH